MEKPARLHIQYIPTDEADMRELPQSFALPPIAKGWPQPVEVGDLIELSPTSIWRIVQRKWRAIGPHDAHLSLWIEPAQHPRSGTSLPGLAVTLH